MATEVPVIKLMTSAELAALKLPDDCCNNCRFSAWTHDGDDYLKCLRFPPTYVNVVTLGDGEPGDNPLFWLQPVVNPRGTCGEFQATPPRGSHPRV